MRDTGPMDKLKQCLAKMPGVGRRSAERLAMALVRDKDGIALELARAIEEARKSVCLCSECGNLTVAEKNPCALCSSGARDGSILCVVEEPADIALVERSGEFRGRYHALLGRVSPMKGIGPDDLRLKDLLDRVRRDGVKEVILALSTDVEGDSTAALIVQALLPNKVTVTRLAMGLPAGSALMYSDPVTLAKALRGRQRA